MEKLSVNKLRTLRARANQLSIRYGRGDMDVCIYTVKIAIEKADNYADELEKQKGPFKAECFHTGEIIASSHSSKELSNSIKELGYIKVDMADHWYRPTPQPRTIIVKEQ